MIKYLKELKYLKNLSNGGSWTCTNYWAIRVLATQSCMHSGWDMGSSHCIVPFHASHPVDIAWHVSAVDIDAGKYFIFLAALSVCLWLPCTDRVSQPHWVGTRGLVTSGEQRASPSDGPEWRAWPHGRAHGGPTAPADGYERTGCGCRGAGMNRVRRVGGLVGWV